MPSEKQKFLRDYYGCNLWKIYEVLEVKHYRSHGNCKIKKTWNVYIIEGIELQDNNSKGQPARIRIFENECKILDP